MKKIAYLFLLAGMAFGCSKSDNGPMSTMSTSGTQSSSGGSGTGQGGSMARFAIAGNHLYIVSDDKLRTYDIGTPGDAKNVGSMGVQGGVETIYPYKDFLYMGTQNGMLIYSRANPASPQYVSNYQHVTSCDPVVVTDKYAYVTLRTEATRCNRGQNLLEVIDISNPQSPRVVKSYAMKQPFGLGIDGNTLFVCDKGLKVYNASDVNRIDQNRITHFTGYQGYDVIAQSDRKLLVATSPDAGIFQYDYTDANKIQLLSTIPVVK